MEQDIFKQHMDGLLRQKKQYKKELYFELKNKIERAESLIGSIVEDNLEKAFNKKIIYESANAKIKSMVDDTCESINRQTNFAKLFCQEYYKIFGIYPLCMYSQLQRRYNLKVNIHQPILGDHFVFKNVTETVNVEIDYKTDDTVEPHTIVYICTLKGKGFGIHSNLFKTEKDAFEQGVFQIVQALRKIGMQTIDEIIVEDILT